MRVLISVVITSHCFFVMLTMTKKTVYIVNESLRIQTTIRNVIPAEMYTAK